MQPAALGVAGPTSAAAKAAEIARTSLLLPGAYRAIWPSTPTAFPAVGTHARRRRSPAA